jgi:hypothetical protein
MSIYWANNKNGESHGLHTFCNVVDLAIDQFTEVVDDGLDVDIPIQQLEDLIVNSGPPPQNVQIQGNDFLTIGSLNLDCNHVTVGLQTGLVYCT